MVSGASNRPCLRGSYIGKRGEKIRDAYKCMQGQETSFKNLTGSCLSVQIRREKEKLKKYTRKGITY